MRASSSRRGDKKSKAAISEFYFGSPFDFTIDMGEEFPITSSRKSKEVQFQKHPTPNSSRSTSKDNTPAGLARQKQDSQRDPLLVGSNSPYSHFIDVVNPKILTENQPPMSIIAFDKSVSIPDAPRAVSTRSNRAPVHMKTYIFGFREPMGYIPHPFVSSHRPKSPPSKKDERKTAEIKAPSREMAQTARLPSKRDVKIAEKSFATTFILRTSMESLI